MPHIQFFTVDVSWCLSRFKQCPRHEKPSITKIHLYSFYTAFGLQRNTKFFQDL